ncbi:hypothetical protein GQ457_02G020440 [Hibiscus cannabinus]
MLIVFFDVSVTVVNRGEDNLQAIAQKSNVVHDAAVPSSNSPKPSSVNGPKVPLPFPLSRKCWSRNEMISDASWKNFRNKFNNFGKLLQSGGVKGDLPTEQATKRQTVGVAVDPATTPSVYEPGASTTIPCTVRMSAKNNSTDNIVSHVPTSITTLSLNECKSSNQQSRPSTIFGHLHLIKCILANRPIAFRVIPPSPFGLAYVDILKGHFLQFDGLSAVELEDVENDDIDMGSKALDNCLVVITYGTRRFAKRAYTNGECWQGNELQFTWLTSSSYGNDPSSIETSLPKLKGSLEVNIQTEGKLAYIICLGVLASGNKGSKSSKGVPFVEHMELPPVSEHNSSPSSIVKKPPKGDRC